MTEEEQNAKLQELREALEQERRAEEAYEQQVQRQES